MYWLRSHVVAVCLIGAAVFAMAAFLTFARAKGHGTVTLPPPPKTALPYTHATFSTADAMRAFRAAGIKLVRHTPRAAPVIDSSTTDLVVVVDVFADPKNVAATGFSDYFIFRNGHWLHAPRTCAAAAPDAERWRGNVRVIVNCKLARGNADETLRRVNDALARL